MAKHKKISNRKRRKRKLVLFVVEIVILALVLLALFAYQKLDLIQNKILDKDKISVNPVTEETLQTFEGYTTIALFGLDNRQAGVYSTGNSDVIMVMSIDNDTKNVNMVSVYRDTYLNIAGVGESQNFRKCNAAYAYGGAEQAINMLNQNLDLDIEDYVSFDFSAVAEAVDILGGVDIEITSSTELNELNKYINHTNKVLGTSVSQIGSTGVQTLNGVQAVAYSRIRYTAGGDFKRAERQRRVLNEMIKKAKRANLVELNELINAVFPDIETSLTNAEMLSMAAAMMNYDMSGSGGFPADRTTMKLGSKGSIVVPCDLLTNVTKLHQQLYGTEEYEPSQTVQDYNYIITVDTGKGVGSAVEDEFSDKDDFTGSGNEEDSNTEGE